MTTNINLKISLEALRDAICTLGLEQKRQLLETLEQKILEEEELTYEENPQTINEIEKVRQEYNAGEYVTLDEYIANSIEPQ